MTRPRAPVLFLLSAGSGILYFLVRGIGLLADLGGSHLNRNPEFSVSIRVRPLLIGLGLTVLSLLLYRFRRTVTVRFLLLMRGFRTHPARTVLLAAGALFVVHVVLFVPFRANSLRLPHETSPDLEVEYRRGEPRTVKARGGFEDYTRNYVISRSIRRLGPGRYFDLHRAPELTGPERDLCAWAVRNHPPGYHLLLAPLTGNPLLARGLSLVLYGLVMALAFFTLRPLVGPLAAALGTFVFWGTPGNLFFIGMMTGNDLAVAVPILAALALVMNARSPRAGRMLIVGLLLGIAFVTKYTAVLGIGLACLGAILRFGWRRGLIGSLWILAGALPVAAAWIVLLSGTESAAMQYDKYLVRFLGKVTDPDRLGASSSTARGSLSSFFAYLPAEWGPPAFVSALAALCWLPFRFRRAGWGGVSALLIFLLPLCAAVIAIPKTNYIYFGQAGLFAFTALFLLKARGHVEAVLCAGAAVLYGLARVILFGLQTF